MLKRRPDLPRYPICTASICRWGGRGGVSVRGHFTQWAVKGRATINHLAYSWEKPYVTDGGWPSAGPPQRRGTPSALLVSADGGAGVSQLWLHVWRTRGTRGHLSVPQWATKAQAINNHLNYSLKRPYVATDGLPHHNAEAPNLLCQYLPMGVRE